MSRIGKAPITIPNKVTVTVDKANVVTVKGPLGELTQKVDPDLTIEVTDGVLNVSRPTDQKRHKALHGLTRALLNNMVYGVSVGYTVNQELVGVGYRVSNQGQNVEFSLGYSHTIMFQLPKEVTVETKNRERFKSADNPEVF